MPVMGRGWAADLPKSLLPSASALCGCEQKVLILHLEKSLRVNLHIWLDTHMQRQTYFSEHSVLTKETRPDTNVHYSHYRPNLVIFKSYYRFLTSNGLATQIHLFVISIH